MPRLPLLIFSLTLSSVESTFHSNPGTINLHENEDNNKLLLTFTPYCTVQTTCSHYYSYSCSTYTCGWEECYMSYKTCYATRYYTCYPTYTCNYCSYSGNSRFYISGTTQFWKRSCDSPGCGPTCSASNCNNAGESYSVSVTCWRSGYQTDGRNSMSFTVSITQNAAPTFYWYHGDPFNVYHTSSNPGDWVNRVIASDSDASIDGDYVRYELVSGVDPSNDSGNTLFTFNTDACYQTPNCTDQTNLTIQDTHGLYTGIGTTNTLYQQNYPQPNDHFTDFHNGWHQLHWNFTRNDFDNLNDPPVKIHFLTGEIYVDRNISIFPAYPYKDFNMTVQVSNPSASCYVSTCNFFTRVWSTNAPISIDNLNAIVNIHEDTVVEASLFTIVTSDIDAHDTVDCSIVSISPNESIPEHFNIRETFNGSKVFQVFSKEAPAFTSATLLYLVTIECHDGHGSTASGTLSVAIDENQAPTILNLNSPTLLAIDAFASVEGELVYTVSTSDTEDDDIIFNCTISDSKVPFHCNSTRNILYVVLRRNLDIIDDKGVIYTFDVCISDAKHYNAACGSIQANITSSKTHPSIINLPQSVSIAEDIAAGALLFKIMFYDPDVGETHMFNLISVDPGLGASLFLLNRSSGELFSTNDFNFEEYSHFKIEFTVQDNTLTSIASKFLYVNITNVNEPPSLDAYTVFANLSEGSLPGIGINFFFNATDQDIDDMCRYSIASGNYASSFSIHPSNGELYLVSKWDLENGFPPSTSLHIVCTDVDGLTAALDVSIEFYDINDNAPTVTVDYEISPLSISEKTGIGETLLTASCSDLDVGDDGFCIFDIIGGGIGVDLFTMKYSNNRSEGATAELRLKSSVSYTFDTVFRFTIKVSDKSGTDALTVGVPVEVSFNATILPAVPRSNICGYVTCTIKGNGLIAGLIVEAVVVVMILCHAIWHCCFKCSRSNKVHDIGRRTTNGSTIERRAENVPVYPSTSSSSVGFSSSPNISWNIRRGHSTVSLGDSDDSSDSETNEPNETYSQITVKPSYALSEAFTAKQDTIQTLDQPSKGFTATCSTSDKLDTLSLDHSTTSKDKQFSNLPSQNEVTDTQDNIGTTGSPSEELTTTQDTFETSCHSLSQLTETRVAIERSESRFEELTSSQDSVITLSRSSSELIDTSLTRETSLAPIEKLHTTQDVFYQLGHPSKELMIAHAIKETSDSLSEDQNTSTDTTQNCDHPSRDLIKTQVSWEMITRVSEETIKASNTIETLSRPSEHIKTNSTKEKEESLSTEFLTIPDYTQLLATPTAETQDPISRELTPIERITELPEDLSQNITIAETMKETKGSSSQELTTMQFKKAISTIHSVGILDTEV